MRPIDDRGGIQRAIGAREAARSRFRRATGAAIAGSVALGGIFAALAAGSTHPKKAGAPAASTRKIAALTSAPAAPLVAVESAGSASSSSTPAESAPATAAPTQSYEPPVVSSGGS